jgi:hypothetical protein
MKTIPKPSKLNTAIVSRTLGILGFASNKKDGHGYFCWTTPQGTEVWWFWPVTTRDQIRAASVIGDLLFGRRSETSLRSEQWKEDTATRKQLEQLQTRLERVGYTVTRVGFGMTEGHPRLLVQLEDLPKI